MTQAARKTYQYIRWFDQIDKDDLPLVGGKGANIGEMTKIGLPVPKGFCVTAKAYFDFLNENKLVQKIKEILKTINLNQPDSFSQASEKIQKLILQGRISAELSREIIFNYLKLGGLLKQALVAIRSSATAEDLPTASFAGQQTTFLNVQGEANVVEKTKACWASLFEPRAIFYRQEKSFDHLKVGLSALIQEMIPADVSGVMFTIDPVTNEKNSLVIEAIYGLGELIVQGQVTPDNYLVNRQTLEIETRHIEKQTVQLIKVGSKNKLVALGKKYQLKRKLTDKQIIQLAKLGQKIHRHYYHPQDIEWVFYKNKFCIVQTRPVTTLIQNSKLKNQNEIKNNNKIVILKGISASPGIGTGAVQLIKSTKELNKINQGDILVTEMTSPDFVTAMKKVNAIITDRGGQTSHAAIVSRELGIPCVVGTEKATKILKNDQIVTVNGSNGEIYKGGIKIPNSKSQIPNNFQIPNFKSQNNLKTATKIYANMAEPEKAQEISRMNVDGVGLLRAEFMLAQIGIHPKKFIHDQKQKLFIEQITKNLVTFGQAFLPRPVVYRATDFKTNEYRRLIGGRAYEPEEENPFLGYRGAFRYLQDQAVFEMEMEALFLARSKYHLNNLWLMIPFCHTPDELRQIKKILAGTNLLRSPSFKLWLMIEIPSNVILLDEFIKVGIDGVSIGSNDLTMLILGLDRDNEQLASIYNENNPAVLWAIEKTIKTCLKEKISCSICGQAPSTNQQLVEKLVNWGITSISVTTDAIDRTRQLVYETERKIIKN